MDVAMAWIWRSSPSEMEERELLRVLVPICADWTKGNDAGLEMDWIWQSRPIETVGTAGAA